LTLNRICATIEEKAMQWEERFGSGLATARTHSPTEILTNFDWTYSKAYVSFTLFLHIPYYSSDQNISKHFEIASSKSQPNWETTCHNMPTGSYR
jgi:hypothetical protein